jgi:hypothetical protein
MKEGTVENYFEENSCTEGHKCENANMLVGSEICGLAVTYQMTLPIFNKGRI